MNRSSGGSAPRGLAAKRYGAGASLALQVESLACFGGLALCSRSVCAVFRVECSLRANLCGVVYADASRARVPVININD